MKILSFVAAASNSGKTTLIEKLTAHVTARGLRVAVVKHASKGFELDQPGKDSWRFRQAGAEAVALAGPDGFALIRRTDRPPDPDVLDGLVGDVDFIFHEGFKATARNKIEVYRAGLSGEPPLCLRDESIIALVSDRPVAGVRVQRFDWNDIEGIADFIMKLQL